MSLDHDRSSRSRNTGGSRSELLALSIREGQVLPRRQGCATKVSGGTLMLTAKNVSEKAEAKFVYRVKYKTKDGDRQISNTYIVSLFP